MTDFNKTDLAGAIEALTVTLGNLFLAGNTSADIQDAAAYVGEEVYRASKEGNFQEALDFLSDAEGYIYNVVPEDDAIMAKRLGDVRDEIKRHMPAERTLRASKIIKGDRINIGGTYHLVMDTVVRDDWVFLTLELGHLTLRCVEPVTVLTHN